MTKGIGTSDLCGELRKLSLHDIDASTATLQAAIAELRLDNLAANW
jgi:hypothetical protein